jgi:hypothetical protein
MVHRRSQAPLIVQDQLDAFFFDQATGSATIDVRFRRENLALDFKSFLLLIAL